MSNPVDSGRTTENRPDIWRKRLPSFVKVRARIGATMRAVVTIHMGFRARIAAPLARAVLALFVGFAAGHIDLLDGLSPVAVPLFLVNLWMDRLPSGPLAAGILLGAGVGLVNGWQYAVGRLLAHGLGLLATRALVQTRAAKGRRGNIALYGAMCQAAGAWVIPLFVRLPEKSTMVAWAAAGVEVVLAALAASLLNGTGEEAGQGNRRLSRVLAFGILTVLGLQGLTLPVAHLRLDYLAVALFTLVGALVDGAGGGAAAGTSFSLALLLGFRVPLPGPTFTATPVAGGAFVAVAAAGIAFASGGLAAGAFRPLGRSFAAVGFSLAFAGALFWAALPDVGFQAALLVPALLAAGVVGLAPERWLDWGTAPDCPQVEAPEAAPSARDRVQRLATVLQEAGRAFEQAAPARPLAPAQALGGSFEAVQQQVCQGCSLYRRCWETDFFRTVQTFEAIWSRVEEQGRISPRNVPDELANYCIYPAAVLATLNSLQEIGALQHQWQRRLAEGRALVAGYVQGVANILDQTAIELRPQAVLSAPTVLTVRHGLARLPGRGSIVSGDSALAELIAEGYYLLVLSDGMGGGTPAARESRQAVTLLRQLLGAGFSASLAVQTVNAALLLGGDEDNFATIDLALLDLAHGRVEFTKTGAVSSLVRRGGDVTFVRGSAPPAGILHHVGVEPEVRPVGSGDVIVMITDGLWQRDAAEPERWLAEYLSHARNLDAQALADGILARAIEICDSSDDMTVLVACLHHISGPPAAEEHRTEVKVVRTARR